MPHPTIALDTRLDSRISRRDLLKGTAAGAGLVVLTGTLHSAPNTGAVQFTDATPAIPALEPLSFGPTVQSKAAELNYDLAQIFRFVSEEVRYEPYSGSLRGANGTLWSLAGNSADKAMLFAALLDESLIEYRFAVGSLNPTQIELLTLQMDLTADSLLNHYNAAFTAANLPPSFGKLDVLGATPEPVVSPEANADYQEMIVRAAQSIADAQTLAENQIAIIAEALTAANITIPELAAATLPSMETDRHVWIQIPDGPNWANYLPAFRNQITPTAADTFNEFPDDLRHTLTIKLVAEEYIGTTLRRRDVATISGAASSLVNVPVGIVALPPGDFEGIGLTINQLFTGEVTLTPVLIAGDMIAVANVPMVFGGAEGTGAVLDAAAGTGLAQGETLALWLSIDCVSPDSEPFHVERAIFDRIGAKRRIHETVVLTDIQPVTLVDFYDGSKTISELASAHVLTVDVARLQAMYGLTNIESVRTFGPVAANGPGMMAIRDALRMHSELEAGYQSVIVEPQLTLSSISLVDPSNSDSAVQVGIDLLRNSPRVLRLESAEAAGSIHPAVHAGVYDQIAEQVTLGTLAQQPGSEGILEIGATVSSIFSAALENDVPIQAITSIDDLGNVQLGPLEKDMIERALADGWFAVTPVRSVEINGADRSGWWLIDPLTGQTRDQLDNGRSHASLIIPTGGLLPEVLTGRAILSWIVRAPGAAFRFVGRKALCIFMFAGVIISGAAFGVAASSAARGGGIAPAVGAAAAAWSGANAGRQAAAAGVC